MYSDLHLEVHKVTQSCWEHVIERNVSKFLLYLFFEFKIFIHRIRTQTYSTLYTSFGIKVRRIVYMYVYVCVRIL